MNRFNYDCETCGAPFISTHFNQHKCKSCRIKRKPVASSKVCIRCGNDYVPTSNRQMYCSTCAPMDRRSRKNIRHYGISHDEFSAAQDEAGGFCQLCGKRCDEEDRNRKLVVDHDHETGKFRGMLCRDCNRGMGFIDNESWLKKALEWRRRGR